MTKDDLIFRDVEHLMKFGHLPVVQLPEEKVAKFKDGTPLDLQIIEKLKELGLVEFTGAWRLTEAGKAVIYEWCS